MMPKIQLWRVQLLLLHRLRLMLHTFPLVQLLQLLLLLRYHRLVLLLSLSLLLLLQKQQQLLLLLSLLRLLVVVVLLLLLQIPCTMWGCSGFQVLPVFGGISDLSLT